MVLEKETFGFVGLKTKHKQSSPPERLQKNLEWIYGGYVECEKWI